MSLRWRRKRGEIVKLLAIGRPSDEADASQIARDAATEMRTLWLLHRDGVVREMHSPGRTCAVLVLEANNKTEAEEKHQHD
jgi:hypothetical protein